MSKFPIHVVLSVTTSQLMCEMDRLYEILNYMTGDNLFTHQLPRAAEVAKPILTDEHPALCGPVPLDRSKLAGMSRDDAFAYVKQAAEEYADLHGLPRVMSVPKIPEWGSSDPVTELMSVRGPRRIVMPEDAEHGILSGNCAARLGVPEGRVRFVRAEGVAVGVWSENGRYIGANVNIGTNGIVPVAS